MAKRRPKLQHYLQYGALRVLAGIMRAVPVDASSWTMGRAFGLVFPHLKRHARAKEHLALAMPDLSEADRERIAREMWRQLGRVAGEAFQIDRILADQSRITVPDNFEEIRELTRDGCIIGTAHVGNWEVGGAVAKWGGRPLAGVYQALHNPLADAYVRRMRGPVYPAGLFAKGGNLGTRLIGLARQGAVVGIVADLREKRGVEVEFFGQPAFATPLPAMLARLSGRPLLAGVVVRENGVHFRAKIERIDVPHSDDRNRDIQIATQRLHDMFERWIRENPEQWMWTHRKWARSTYRPLAGRTSVDAERVN